MLFLQMCQQVTEHPALAGGGHNGLEGDVHLCLLHQVEQGVHILILEVGEGSVEIIVGAVSEADLAASDDTIFDKDIFRVILGDEVDFGEL